MVSPVDQFLAQTAFETGRPEPKHDQPLTNAERQRRKRARRRGELAPYPWLADNLYAHVAVTRDGCLEWQRSRNARGYGFFKRDGKNVYAHRESLEQKLGRAIKPEHYANHTCDNPPCINPAHLYEGTPEENAADRELRRRPQDPF